MGAERNVFNFDFKQNVTCNNENGLNTDFVNIVNTEAENYGTIFNGSAYDHISMTTTVNLGGHGNSTYERLYLANSNTEENSITNLDSTYEYLFPQNNASGQSNSNSGQSNSNSGQSSSNSTRLVNSAPLVSRNVVERSHSQNSCDGRLRERLLRTRNQNSTPKPNKIGESCQFFLQGLTNIKIPT